ncbi:MAG: ZIP family metal transporter [Desulfurococcales archaeon]|nr:ZIP family metal transporter [Desulfurococcales archaeon]
MTDLIARFSEAINNISGGNPVILALIMSSIAAMLTTIGALPILYIGRKGTGKRLDLILDIGLGFSSGVMIVASFTSLLLPAIDLSGFIKPSIGFMIGAGTIWSINKLVPHEHFIKGYEGPKSMLSKTKTAWLVATAIIIHNLPEGMAIGLSAVYSLGLGIATGLAIGFQDIPEGLAVALPVALITGSAWKGVFYGMLSGLSEVVLAIPAAYIGIKGLWMMPYLLGFGSGAMVYVVSHEALPESHRTGHENEATLGFFIGFLLMLYLDTVFG